MVKNQDGTWKTSPSSQLKRPSKPNLSFQETISVDLYPAKWKSSTAIASTWNSPSASTGTCVLSAGKSTRNSSTAPTVLKTVSSTRTSSTISPPEPRETSSWLTPLSLHSKLISVMSETFPNAIVLTKLRKSFHKKRLCLVTVLWPLRTKNELRRVIKSVSSPSKTTGSCLLLKKKLLDSSWIHLGITRSSCQWKCRHQRITSCFTSYKSRMTPSLLWSRRLAR